MTVVSAPYAPEPIVPNNICYIVNHDTESNHLWTIFYNEITKKMVPRETPFDERLTSCNDVICHAFICHDVVWYNITCPDIICQYVIICPDIIYDIMPYDIYDVMFHDFHMS